VKLNSFLRKIAETGGIRDNDFEAALGASALAEVEIPDTIDEKFNQSFLTRERAKSDPEIVKFHQNDIRKAIFDNVDKHVEYLLPFADDETKEKVKGTFETYKKLELLKEGIERNIKNQKGKAASEDVRKIEQEWADKIKIQKESHDKELNDMRASFKEEKLVFALKQKINKFQFGEAFKDLKDTLSNSIIDKVRSQSFNDNRVLLELAEDGVNVHVRQNVDGSLRDVFDKENKVTIDSLIQKEVEPFVVKSGGSGGNGQQQNNGSGGGKKTETPKNATLHEQMWAQKV
jgi:hypothetical protein